MAKWETNNYSSDRVIYDTVSHSELGNAPNYGYAFSTPENQNPNINHAILIGGLEKNRQYYFRPVSKSNLSEVVGKELMMTLGSVSSKSTLPENLLPAASISGECNYLFEYLRFEGSNSVAEVQKLQSFLRDFEGFKNLAVTGVFDRATLDAVSLFQDKYSKEILEPWGLNSHTGNVYLTTKKKVNELYCKKDFPLTKEQLREIEYYRTLLEQKSATPILPEVGKTTEEKNAISTSTALAGLDVEISGEPLILSPEEKENSGMANLAALFLAYKNQFLYGLLFLFGLAAAFFAGIKREKLRTEKISKKKIETIDLASSLQWR